MGAPDDRWAERRAELDDRIREIHRRNEELADRVREAQTHREGNGEGEGQRPAGSTPAQVGRAEVLARLSTARALEAYRRAAIMRLRAATAHDRAASTYESLHSDGEAAARDCRAKAEQHRRLAAADRAAARELLESGAEQAVKENNKPSGGASEQAGAP